MNIGSGNDAPLQKVDEGFYQCKLSLKDDTEFIIPMRSDGYIHATKLCQSANKQLYKWKNSPDTEELLNYFQKTSGLPMNKIIEVRRGNTKNYEQGTWIHPDLGVQLAQWCSPIFSIQVSRWIRELTLTGSVLMGKEKSAEQLQKSLEDAINKAEHAEQLNTSLLHENKRLQAQYDKLYLNHQYYLKRKKLHKLPEGKCIYIVNTTGDDNNMKLKIGKSENITGRVSGFRTSSPLCKLMFLMYTDQHHDIEKHIKRIYEDNRPNDREFIEGVPLEDLKHHFIKLADVLQSNYQIETHEQLTEFNKHLITEEEAQEDIEKETEEEQLEEEPKIKRCGGQWHETEEDRMVSIDLFYRHKSHKDGRARLCKDCYARSQNRQGYNTKLQRDKPIPPYNTTTHKWCNRCENVKKHEEFHNSSSTKDGLMSNCKACKADQKQQNKQKQQEQTS